MKSLSITSNSEGLSSNRVFTLGLASGTVSSGTGASVDGGEEWKEGTR